MIGNLRIVPLVAICLASAQPACTFGDEPKQGPGLERAVFEDFQPETKVQGFVWDPEAYYLGQLHCYVYLPEGECLEDPVMMSFVTPFLRSLVGGSTVTAVDSKTREKVATADADSDPEGAWFIQSVKPGGSYLLRADPTDETGTYLEDMPFFGITPEGWWDKIAELPPAPAPTVYFPTVNLRAMPAHYATCYNQQAGMFGNNGFLDAVARFRTYVEENPTTAEDFVNPEKFGGVAVFMTGWPGYALDWIPFDMNTTVEASAGTVYNIEWAPEGVLPPEWEVLQTPRGFLMGEDVSSLGITVVLLPPSSGSTTELTVTAKDSVEDAEMYRPWVFAPFTAQIEPGVVSYATLRPNTPPNPLSVGNDPYHRFYWPYFCQQSQEPVY